jgi:aspartyl-tRNA(Asn)/glutamyl-tRNA(Gln) amidotransferase subunit B
VRAALALDGEVDRESRFDRKNYFYCDLPKGFQTTQYERPFCTGSRGEGLALASGRRVRLTRIHLEEDAGKAIHDRGTRTLVDLNRAGVPLIEIVTEPDLTTPEEAYEFLKLLKEILRYAGVSDCDMEKGSLRCDVNVSVRRPDEGLGTRVELKNLNSFRNVARAIEREVERQVDAREAGRPLVQETRLFDPDSGETRTMRTKEDEDDYRYFAEPDLPPARVDAALLAAERDAIPELPADRRRRYVGELGLSDYDAGVLTGARATADFFEATVAAGADPKTAANWVTNEVLAALADREVPGDAVDALRLTPADLAELAGLVAAGTLHTGGARRALAEMLRTGAGPAEVVRALGLEQVSDTAAIESWCRAALEGQERVIADVRAGREKALGALVGPVMKASSGSANPAVVRETLLRLIAESET